MRYYKLIFFAEIQDKIHYDKLFLIIFQNMNWSHATERLLKLAVSYIFVYLIKTLFQSKHENIFQNFKSFTISFKFHFCASRII